jgi:hypothetical protein
MPPTSNESSSKRGSTNTRRRPVPSVRAITWLREYGGSAWGVDLAPSAAPAELARWLETRSLVAEEGGTAKFWRAPVLPASSIACALELREADASVADDFGATAQAGFEMPAELARSLGALVGRPRWRTYVAYDGSTPAAAAAMFLDRGYAWLGIGATLPHHRGRGAQNALLERRIRDAVALGVRGLAVETEAPAAGEEPGASYRNIVRAGFALSHVRRRYVTHKT